MPVVVVTSVTPGAGKTGVAAAIARYYAYQGKGVRLARVASAEGHSADDAAYYAGLDFVPGSPAGTIVPEHAADPGEGQILVVEADTESAKKIEGATVILVARGERPAKAPDGLSPAATIVTDVQAAKVQPAVEEEGKPLTVDLSEDRVLAGFSIDEVQRALNAEVLVEGDLADATCSDLVIAPISSDAGQPYFTRFESEAVVVRFDRTDMHLAALRGEPAVLVLTGGRRPSDYTFDAAGAKGVPVLLSRTDTENTVIALEHVFDQTRFMGERKLDRMSELLEQTALFRTLPL